MASDTEAQGPGPANISSEDDSLSTLKRKESVKKEYYEDSEDEPLMTDVIVTVEVEESAEDAALNFNSKRDNTAVSKKKKKQKQKKLRTFRCATCEAVFNTAPDLKGHSLEHQVQTRHKCEQCGRCFKKAFSLRLHKRVHMEKLEKCPLCDLTFNLRINLGRHMMSHERTEVCDVCPAKFHTKEQLEEHASVHAQESNEALKNSSVAEMCKATQNERDTDGSAPEIKAEVMEASDNSNEVLNMANDTLNPFFDQYDGFLNRESLSHPTQCAIVSKMHKGRSVADICRLYNLTPEVVNEIWEDREKYALPKKAGKRTTKYMNSILDTRIVDWFHNQRANDIQVSGKMLQDVAEAFAKECGFVAFNGSKKWLDRFKKRYNISLRVTPTKRDYHNVALESKWKKQFFKEQWCDIRVDVSDEDIYTADEVGVYYNPSKGRIKKLAGKKFIQGYVKDRLAIFMCANIPGTDKKKLLVCGMEDPLIHSHRDPDTLPVTYIRHSQAHFTTQMFEEYVKYWNRELQLNNRTAILILDRATIHSKLQLSHLKLVFVPWKAANGLIPIKNGVYASFRDQFRRLILEEKAMNVLRGVDRNITCLEALYMLEKAWERTPADVITRSFVNTGYDVSLPQESECDLVPKVCDNDEEILCKMLKDYDVESYFTDLGNLDMYLTVDEELLTGQGTNGSVFGGNHRVNDPLEYAKKDIEEILPLATDKPESVEKEELIKKSRALQDLEIVRKYLLSNNTSYETYCSYMEVEKFVMRSPINYES